MKVLIGVDGSAASLAAVEFMARMLSPTRDELVFYYAPPSVRLKTHTAVQPEILENLHESLAEAVFTAAQKRLDDAWEARLTTISGTQQAAHGILVAADESRAEMIVVGARGTAPASSIGIGSVTRHVVHSTPLPVLVVREPSRDPAQLRVLLACDGSESSRKAGLLLNRFDWPAQSAGRVITVVESLVADHLPEWLEAEIREKQAAGGYLERTAEELTRAREDLLCHYPDLPEMFRQQEPIVAQGTAANRILETVKSDDIDLVVLGARQLGAWGRFFLGSTSDKILVHTTASVLIVREHEKP